MSRGAWCQRDGDEMQLHVPQDLATDYEVNSIMGVNSMIVSSQANSPIMGVFQDGIIGAKLMIETETIPKSQFMDCIYEACCENDDTPIKRFLELKKREDFSYSGKMLFSVLLPDNFYYKKSDVIIEKGIVLEGILDKKIIGKSYYSIQHRLYKEYSIDRASKFLSSVQRLLNRFLIFHGFSVGISDFLYTQGFKQQVEESLRKMDIEVSQIDSNDPKYEFKINKSLNSAGNNLKYFEDENNRLELMIKTGAKGAPPNIKQIRAFLGQNTVEGHRVEPTLDNRTRTLPCFKRGDSSPITRGFIASGFLNGLDPAENFFHTMAGREGVINTAVKTQDIGYTERKMVKRMENLVIEHDYSLRNAGHIVSFVYGGDNLNSTWYIEDDDNCNFIDVENIVKSL